MDWFIPKKVGCVSPKWCEISQQKLTIIATSMDIQKICGRKKTKGNSKVTGVDDPGKYYLVEKNMVSH